MSPRGRFHGIAVLLALTILVVSATPASAGQSAHGVGVIVERFVDDTRVTPLSGDSPEKPERTLETSIFYPTLGAGGAAVPDAVPDTDHGPYPIIVFSHGFSATPATYEDFIAELVAAGNVVAAPKFPLSSGGNETPPDAGDVVNQPADVSFVYDEIVGLSRDDDGPLAGLIDAKAFGVAGHSNGGITTMGLISHECCKDKRIKAAAVLAGTPSPYGDGDYNFKKMPPFIVVHGTEDSAVPYEDIARVFNTARAPRAFLTVEGGGHGSAATPSGPAGPSVVASVVDFFAAFLEDDEEALARLPEHAVPGVTDLVDATEKGSKNKIPIEEGPELDRLAEVSPDRGLEGGQLVTVRWSGFSPGGVVNVVQCSPDRSEGTAGCDLARGKILQPDPTGEGELQIEVVEGPVGKAICDADNPPCVIFVNDDSSLLPEASILVKIRFAK
ncbi:MAG: hypothetical protein FJW86_13205 [Actinobacteria bacterium]|nr:hypothetical protein [Actinomycetota bacterium]